MRYCVLLISVWFSFQLQAQKGVSLIDGWVKTKKGDTLKGKVCWFNTATLERMDKIIYVDAAGAKKRFGADKISSFGNDTIQFDFVKLESEQFPLPMHRIVDGENAALYKAWHKTPASTAVKFDYEEAVYINFKKAGKNKDATAFVEIFDDGNFVKQMKKLFKGDEDLVNQIKDNNWSLKDLDKIVATYNER